jgi:hypothetical protein
MLFSQRLAIAAHMHVLLRRKTGRVTDTEWMAENLEYALEIARFARAKVLENGDWELSEWAEKLERAAREPRAAPHKPMVQQASQLLKSRYAPAAAPADLPLEASDGFGTSTVPSTGFGESSFDPDKRKPKDPDAPRYVGGIR